jgi:hypothetical protein
MAVQQAQIISFSSITTIGIDAPTAVDRVQPLTFVQWLPYNKQTFTTPENALAQYQKYITDWYTVQGNSTIDLSNAVQNLYVNLLNEIIINYATVEERRYFENLDFNSPTDLAIAVPFFAKKIKDVCLYYTTLRETAQTAVVQYNLKGSNIGVNTLLYNTIANALRSQDLTSTIDTLNLSISSITDSMVLNIEDIYDLTPDYFDTNPTLPASAYDTSGDIRQTYFAANQVSVDPFLTLDFNQSIVNAILQYPIYTTQLGTQLLINPAIQPTQLNLLKDKDFINNKNTNNAKDLTLNTLFNEQEKYIGADFYYVITDSTLTTFTSGQLFTATSEFANVLNKRYPTIASVPSRAFLKTGKEMGLFFKPDKIGLLQFTNFNFTASVDLSNLKPSTVYYFPDPAKYGNVTSNTKQNFVTPLAFFENSYFNKVDAANNYQFGDVDSKSEYQLFRSYQSREQTLVTSDLGLSRYTDYQDYFIGELDTIWNNIDAYPLTPINQYPIDQRTQNLLTVNSTLVQFKGDIYGNQYGLYKNVTTTKAPLSSPIINNASITDLILDGSSYTVTPPADNTLNAGSLAPGSPPPTISIRSYGLKNELFTPSYVNLRFVITTSDCETFVDASGKTWIDSSSDSVDYNPNIYGIYYSILAEGGVNIFGDAAIAGNIASFVYPTTGFELYDGYQFLVDYYDASNALVRNYDPLSQQYIFDYIEPATFVTTRIPGLSSTLDFSLTGNAINVSLYDSRNTQYGTLYCRTPDSTIIAPFSAALSATYTKYTTISSVDYTTGRTITIGDEINTRCISFDVYYDTLQIETSNHLLFDKIRFDYTKNITANSITYSYLTRGYNIDFEKFSNTWFNETNRQLIVCQTKLFGSLSATNYKIIYPKIFVTSVDNPQIKQIYPSTADTNIALSSIARYSLSGTNIDLDVVLVEKPVLSYNNETNIYDLSYLCKDTSNAFYTVNVKFKYINGVLTVLSTTLYKPSNDTLHQNFGTYNNTQTFVLPTLSTYNILNNTYGNPFSTTIGNITVSDSTFTFNIIDYGNNQFLLAQDNSFIVQQDGTSFIVL